MDAIALRIWQYLDESLGRSGRPQAFTPQSISDALEVQQSAVVPAMKQLWDAGVISSSPASNAMSPEQLARAQDRAELLGAADAPAWEIVHSPPRRPVRPRYFTWPNAKGQATVLFLVETIKNHREALLVKRERLRRQLSDAEASVWISERLHNGHDADVRRTEVARIRTEIGSLEAEFALLAAEPNRAQSRSREHIPKDVQREVWRRDNGRCVDCGTQEKLHFDHIIPVSKGGSNTARNIQLLCEKCNLAKGNRI